METRAVRFDDVEPPARRRGSGGLLCFFLSAGAIVLGGLAGLVYFIHMVATAESSDGISGVFIPLLILGGAAFGSLVGLLPAGIGVVLAIRSLAGGATGREVTALVLNGIVLLCGLIAGVLLLVGLFSA